MSCTLWIQKRMKRTYLKIAQHKNIASILFGFHVGMYATKLHTRCIHKYFELPYINFFLLFITTSYFIGEKAMIYKTKCRIQSCRSNIYMFPQCPFRKFLFEKGKLRPFHQSTHIAVIPFVHDKPIKRAFNSVHSRGTEEPDVYERFYSCRQCWASKCRDL
jgi:hypothetical protein